RSPRLDASWVFDVRRHHADDGERLLLDDDPPPDDVRRAAVSPLPEPVRDDQHALCAVHIVCAAYGATQDRLHVEYVEEAASHGSRSDVARSAAFRDGNRQRADVADTSDALE